MMQKFFQENKKIIIMICILGVIMAIVGVYNIIVAKKPAQKTPVQTGQVALSEVAKEYPQWDENYWNVENNCFSFYFKSGLLCFSKYDLNMNPYGQNIVVCFYGEDNTQFMSSQYIGADNIRLFGSVPALQFVGDQMATSIKVWRSNQQAVAIEELPNLSESFYYYVLTPDNFDFTTNTFLGTQYSFNPGLNYAVDTNNYYLSEKNLGLEYIQHYGYTADMYINYANKFDDDEFEYDEKTLKMIGGYDVNIGTSYYVVTAELYDEFIKIDNLDDKIAFCNEKVLSSKKGESYILEISETDCAYQSALWAMYLDNEVPIDSNFNPWYGSFGGSANEYQPTNVSLSSYLAYTNMCSIQQAKNLTDFINEYINGYPNLMK